MIFNLYTTNRFYNNEDKIELEKVGFKFEEHDSSASIITADWYLPRRPIQKEFNTLEEILEFSKTFGEIIINAKDMYIEIYNDYRE